LSNFTGKISCRESLAERTTFKIGGTADIFVQPVHIDELIKVVKFCTENMIPFFVLGGGSNVVFGDDGFAGAVISTAKLNSVTILDEDEIKAKNLPSLSRSEFFMQAESGCSMEKLLSRGELLSLSGLEEFAGLPATIGGAVFMNARCYGKSFSDVLQSVSYLDTTDFKVKDYYVNPSDWDYKKSPFQDEEKIILSAVFKVQKGKAEDIAAKMESFIEDREEKGHFRFPSAGSVFKNNREFGKPTGLIIDEAGLRGHKIGGAQIAPWHGNIIINTGGAKAGDVMELVEYIKKCVKEKTGFELETEILFVQNEE
jgi:UDP-N-acetylmuramate dehydrogenase